MDSIDFEELLQVWNRLSPGLRLSLAITLGLLAVCAVVSIVISIYLAINYHRYNTQQNSVNMTGEAIARRVLDDNGLHEIAVKCSGSFLFGNSYSHYFHKVRLRRLTWKKTSVSSLAMATQKSCLAILDRDGDPDMVKRVRLTPFIYMGPIACLPLIIIGVLLDYFVFKSTGIATAVGCVVGLVSYVISFIMAIMVLKTEVKAQELAYSVCRSSGLATESEIEDMKALFRLYNIEYVNNMITALLELILRVLSIFAKAELNKNSSSSD